MASRESFLSGISWFQVVAGALAAMTSAWIASTLGVAGTLIGAALGSLVLTTSSAFYANTLNRTRKLIVSTDSGARVETHADPGETAVAVQEVAEATDSTVTGAEVVEESRTIRWKLVAVTTAIALALSGAAIGTYELVSGKAYGSDPENTRIVNPFGGTSTTSEEEDDEPAEQERTPAPTASTPTPGRTPAPTPTPSPTVSSPVPSPVPTAPPEDDAE